MIRMIVNMGSSSEAMLKYLLGIWLIWGMNWVVMKSANEYFDPAVFVAWRFGTGALILLGVCLYKRLSLPEKNYWPWIIGSGILSGCLNPVLIQLGMVELGAGLAAMLNYTMPVWVLILAQFIIGERLTLRKIICILLCVAGLAVLLNIDVNGSLNSMLLAIGAAWSWALSNVITRWKLKDCQPIQLTTAQTATGAIGMFIYLAILSRPDTVWCTASVMVVIYNGLIASAIAFLMWTYVLQNMEAGKASIAILVVPVVGVIGGIVFLGETVTLKTAIGMLLVAAGVAGTVKS